MHGGLGTHGVPGIQSRVDLAIPVLELTRAAIDQLYFTENVTSVSVNVCVGSNIACYRRQSNAGLYFLAETLLCALKPVPAGISDMNCVSSPEVDTVT